MLAWNTDHVPDIAMNPDNAVTYAAAPAEFLGDKVFSYAQSLHLNIILQTGASSFQLEDSMPVVLSGNGKL